MIDTWWYFSWLSSPCPSLWQALSHISDTHALNSYCLPKIIYWATVYVSHIIKKD